MTETVSREGFVVRGAAHSKRSWAACRAPAVRGLGCLPDAWGSGRRSRGQAQCRYRHGGRTKKAMEAWAEVQALMFQWLDDKAGSHSGLPCLSSKTRRTSVSKPRRGP